MEPLDAGAAANARNAAVAAALRGGLPPAPPPAPAPEPSEEPVSYKQKPAPQTHPRIAVAGGGW